MTKASSKKVSEVKEKQDVIEKSPDTPRTPDHAPKGEAKERAKDAVEGEADAEDEAVEVVEVGVDPYAADMDHQAYNELLQEAAAAKAAKAPKLTQPEVVFSWQEQQDPAHQKRIARESQRAQGVLDRERAVQNQNYLDGR